MHRRVTVLLPRQALRIARPLALPNTVPLIHLLERVLTPPQTAEHTDHSPQLDHILKAVMRYFLDINLIFISCLVTKQWWQTSLYLLRIFHRTFQAKRFSKFLMKKSIFLFDAYLTFN